MPWHKTMTTMLRVLISDLSSTPTYTDERLEQLLVVAANYVYMELDFNQVYTITLCSPDISPDPTATATRDDAFVNFTVLKAACLADWSTFRTKALLNGLEARLGPAMLKVTEHLEGFKTLLEDGPCAAYEEMKMQYQFGNVTHVKAILSPFVGNNFDPISLSRRGSGFYGNPRSY